MFCTRNSLILRRTVLADLLPGLKPSNFGLVFGGHQSTSAPWVSDVEKELSSVPVMPEWSIDIESFSKAPKKIHNWKSPGLNCVQGFWVKYFSSLHPILISFFNDLLSDGGASLDPNLVRGRTVLILKNPSKGNSPDNCRPITNC